VEEIDSSYLSFPEPINHPPINREAQKSINWFRSNQKRGKEKSKKETPRHIPNTLKSSLVKYNKAVNTDNPNFEPDDTKDLQVGMEVEHQRFGFGKVLHLEGSQGNQKATVFFSAAGQKQLLLKYAKLKVIGN
jgi:DNA helicase-2/ATP-dependent DNA helicase PcrA